MLTIVVLVRARYSKREKRDVRALAMMRKVYQSYTKIPDFSRMRKQSVPGSLSSRAWVRGYILNEEQYSHNDKMIN